VTIEFERGRFEDGEPWIRIVWRQDGETREICVKSSVVLADQMENEALGVFDKWWEKLR